MKFLPKINAFEFTTIAFVIGIVLCDDLTPAEQNSVGNFFMLVGQVLSTKEFVRLCSIRDIYKIISSIVLIVDIAFVLAFFL